MTTFQLAMRLCECLVTSDWSKLPLVEAERVQEAAQAGLNEFFGLLPPERMQEPVTLPLRAPVTQSIDIVQGARTFAYVAGGSAYPAGGYAREADAIGLLAQVGGDTLLNRLVRPGELRTPHLGAGGVQSLTLWGDALPMAAAASQAVGDPRCITGSQRSTLLPAPPFWERPFLLEVGTPRYWWTESLAGATRGSSPMWLLRVWPVPAEVCYLELTLASFPGAITFLDLHDEARVLPVAPHEELDLLALCKAHLTIHPQWRADLDKAGIQNAAENARDAMRGRNRPLNTTPNRVGTPAGY